MLVIRFQKHRIFISQKKKREKRIIIKLKEYRAKQGVEGCANLLC